MGSLAEQNRKLRGQVAHMHKTLAEIRALTLVGQGIEKGKSLGEPR